MVAVSKPQFYTPPKRGPLAYHFPGPVCEPRRPWKCVFGVKFSEENKPKSKKQHDSRSNSQNYQNGHFPPRTQRLTGRPHCTGPRTKPKPQENPDNVSNATRISSNSYALKVKGSKIACLNVTSLPKHIDEIRLLLYWSREFEILALNETRLDDSIHRTVKLKLKGMK